MRRQFAVLQFLVILALLPPLTATAQPSPQAKTENVTARLVTAVDAVAPGQEILIGLHQDIREHWHTYWKNPGDSGLPTMINWQTPEGAAIGPIQWPAPERLPFGPLVNYGYSDEVLLLSRVTIPDSAEPGDTLRFTAEAEWLVCKEICIPESGTLSLTLPVQDAPGAQTAWAERIAQTAAALPDRHPLGPARYEADAERFLLDVRTDLLAGMEPADVWFFPADYGVIDHAAEQRTEGGAEGLRLSAARGGGDTLGDRPVDGVLVIKTRGPDGSTAQQSFAIEAEPAEPGTLLNAAPMPRPAAAAGQPGTDSRTPGGGGIALWRALLFAVAGGLLLNLMPCVFPVLSMKALSLIKHGHDSTAKLRVGGIAYTAGVLFTFSVIAVVLIGLQAGGARVGWGFQLQSPVFVTLLVYLFFLLALNLAGYFEIGSRLMGVGDGLTRRTGFSGSFFTGALAVVVATPCTAPFMGPALFFALTQPWPLTLAVFWALAIGLALPFLALSLAPELARAMPRPGPWMERFRQFLAFPMFGAAIWLLWVLDQEAGANGVAAALIGCLLLAFAIWLWRGARTAPRRIWRAGGGAVAALALIAAVLDAQLIGTLMTPPRGAANESVESKAGGWTPFSSARLAELRAQGKPVFVNLTAAWCITCKVNERVALDTPATRSLFAKNGIVPLKGDWTNRDPEISALLERFDRVGVPLYVLYPPGGSDQQPIVLPQLLTESIVAKKVRAL